MKNNKIIISLAFVLCFTGGFYVSKLTTSCPPPPLPPTPVPGTFDSCYSCNSKHCTIPLPDILTMIGKYKDDRSDIINNISHPLAMLADGTPSSNFQDGRATVFNLEELKQYICKVESAVRESGLDATAYGLAGLRFYYTVYPSSPLFVAGSSGGIPEYMKSIPNEYREKHSLLIMPTYKLGNEYIDYDPEQIFPIGHSSNSTGSPIPRTMDSIPTSASILAYDPNFPCKNGLNSMNHGGMCPPHCPQAMSLLDLTN